LMMKQIVCSISLAPETRRVWRRCIQRGETCIQRVYEYGKIYRNVKTILEEMLS
jgi:hypothetical protein